MKVSVNETAFDSFINRIFNVIRAKKLYGVSRKSVCECAVFLSLLGKIYSVRWHRHVFVIDQKQLIFLPSALVINMYSKIL